MKNILIIIILLITSCSNEQRYEAEGSNLQTIKQEQELVDSLERMMNFIGYIDSAHVVEQVSSNFTKLKEKDARLESELIQTKSELRKTKRELVQTKDSLIKTKEIVRAIYDISNDSSSNFKLLPIEKPEVSETDSI